MPNETVGEAAHVEVADHPKRTDSPAYLAARRMLMNTRRGGCVVCGGVPDMSHPEMTAVADAHGLEDHHGGGIYVKDVLVAFNLFPMEWSQGWGADPVLVQELVSNLNVILEALGEEPYSTPITDVTSLMSYVDSKYNANVKLCRPHHIGTQGTHSPDANGHEGVGIHEIPAPIFWGQLTCNWKVFDMWGGTTGTMAVAPATDANGQPLPGHVVVHHVDASAHPGVARGAVLPPHHAVARLAHAGAHVDLPG